VRIACPTTLREQRALRDDALHGNPEIDVQALAAGDFELAGIQPELVKDRGV
jgi:hypothetical protein